MYQSILTAGMLLVSTAVLADQPALAKVREVIYQCDQLPQLRVSYAQDGAQASVALPSGKLVVLPARPVASGFLYATPQHSLRGKGDEVTFTIGRRTPMQCRSGDNVAEASKASWDLQNTYWRLQMLNDQAVVLAEQQREPHLVLGSKDGRMHGFAGCNRMMGGYELQGNSLRFKGVAVTMMACPTGMDTEAAFTRALERVAAYRLDVASLTLLDGEGKVLAQLEATALK